MGNLQQFSLAAMTIAEHSLLSTWLAETLRAAATAIVLML